MKKIFIILSLIFVLASCSDVDLNNRTDLQSNNIQNTVSVTEKNVDISKPSLLNVSLDTFKTELAKNDSIVIDLRTTKELEKTWIISWAKQIDYYASDFKDKLNSLDKNKKYLIYCASGWRSGQTLWLMKNLWFTNVYELRWWMNGWLRNWEKTVSFPEEIDNNMMMKDGESMNWNDMMDKTITLNATKWKFDKTEIRVKKGENVKIKVNNIDWLHWIAIPWMQLMDDNEIKIDTSKPWTYTYQCLNYCWEWHANMTGTLIIE